MLLEAVLLEELAMLIWIGTLLAEVRDPQVQVLAFLKLDTMM